MKTELDKEASTNSSTVTKQSDDKSLKVTYKGYETTINTETGSMTQLAKIVTSSEGGQTASELKDDTTIYGDYVDYGIDLDGDGDTTNDWRIFYIDDTNIYIISAGYVKSDLIGTWENNKLNTIGLERDKSNYGDYSVWWNQNDVNSMSGLQNVTAPARFLFSGYTLNSSNANSKIVSTMLNTNNWNNFVNENADYAIGGPTLEMFCTSFNQKYPDETYPIDCGKTDDYGYYVFEPYSDVWTTSMCGPSDFFGDLYFLEDWADVTYYYWMASPTGEYEDSLWTVNYSGYIAGNGYGCDMAIRPVVSLKSSISLDKADGETVWTIIESP